MELIKSKVKVWAGLCSRCRSGAGSSVDSVSFWSDRWLVAAPLQPPPLSSHGRPLCVSLLCPLFFLEGHLSLDLGTTRVITSLDPSFNQVCIRSLFQIRPESQLFGGQIFQGSTTQPTLAIQHHNATGTVTGTITFSPFRWRSVRTLPCPA